MGNPPTCTFKNDKYLVIIIDDSMNTCDEVIETTKTFPTKSTSTKVYILTTYSLITTALLTAAVNYKIEHKFAITTNNP